MVYVDWSNVLWWSLSDPTATTDLVEFLAGTGEYPLHLRFPTLERMDNVLDIPHLPGRPLLDLARRLLDWQATTARRRQTAALLLQWCL